MAFDSLFSEIQYGHITARNRIMQLATTSNLDERGHIGDAMVAFHEERARNGVGAIVSPGLAAHPSAHGLDTSGGRVHFGAFDREMVEQLRRLATAVQRHDVPIFGQVYHGGRQHHASRLPMVWGPSAIPCPHSGGVPHEMSPSEIDSVIEGFVSSAVTLRDAGFDGVEVHAAQGHLIQEFISPFSNQRDDEYGGAFENRMRFALKIVDGIRKRCGTDWVVGVRIAGDERSPGGIDLEMACQVAKALDETGEVDYLSVSMGNFNSIELHIPDRHYPILAFAHYAEAIRNSVGDLPVIACGRVITPENANALVAAGRADAVGLSRPLLADEQWARKAAEGRSNEIRKCISCNECWADIVNDQPVRCVHNAATGREYRFGGSEIRTAPTCENVVVVGGGPAGMEAARVAASRGHHVTLFEREAELGGQVAIAARIPGHEEIGYVADYLVGALDRLGVDVRLGTEASADIILEEEPHAVIVATGSVPTRAHLGAPLDFPVLTSHDVVQGGADTGKRAIVFDEDGYYQAPEVAEFMARNNGTEIMLVTRFFEVGREIPMTSRVTTIRALDELGVSLTPNAWYAGVDGRSVVLQHYMSEREWAVESIDCLVHVGYNRAENEIAGALNGKVPRIRTVGDAYMPRRIRDAVSEGHLAARQL